MLRRKKVNKIISFVIILAVCLSFSSCGSKFSEDINVPIETNVPVETDVSKDSLVSNQETAANASETDSSDKEQTDENKAVEPLEESDFAVVQGENKIILDYPYADFKYNEPEEPQDNNYVGAIYSGEYVYKTYLHIFQDFNLYVSNANYNLKGRNFDSYYITQIALKNSSFSTIRGIYIGSDAEEVERAYGPAEVSTIDGKTNLNYRLNDKGMSFVIGEDQKVEGIDLYIIVEE
jgi:hypothetical protein